MARFPFIKQMDAMDCGPTSLAIIAKYYGKTYSIQTLRERSFITREGVSMLGTSDAAESIGMRTMGVRLTFEKLAKEAVLPCIAHWKQNHFIVVYKVKNDMVYVSDPAHGLVKFTKEEFCRGWISTKKEGEDQLGRGQVLHCNILIDTIKYGETTKNTISRCSLSYYT